MSIIQSTTAHLRAVIQLIGVLFHLHLFATPKTYNFSRVKFAVRVFVLITPLNTIQPNNVVQYAILHQVQFHLSSITIPNLRLITTTSISSPTQNQSSLLLSETTSYRTTRRGMPSFRFIFPFESSQNPLEWSACRHCHFQEVTFISTASDGPH